MKLLTAMLLGTLWLAAIGVGTHVLLMHAHTPGSPALAPGLWPQKSRLLPATGQPTLVMFAHPRCPCTQASLAELDQLMTAHQGHIQAYVLFFQPEGAAEDWSQISLWDSARAIPGVTVQADPEGGEAQLFHAGTSGHVAVYDTRHRLLYNGGITPARGHTGDAAWRNAVAAAAGPAAESFHAAPVFGCKLLDRASRPGKGAVP